MFPPPREGFVRVKFRLIYQYLTEESSADDKNSYLVFLDGERILEDVLDASGARGVHSDPIVEVPKGEHGLRIILGERDLEWVFDHDFVEDIGFFVYLDPVDRKDLVTGKFPFDKQLMGG